MDRNMFGWKGVLLLAGAFALFVLAYTGIEYQGVPEDSPGGAYAPRRGSPAPDFTLPDLSGRLVTLSSLRGRVVFINFWATWCGPCRWELPSMGALYTDYRNKTFEMLAVNVDEMGADKVKAWVERYKLPFPVLKDGDDLPVSQAYRTYSIPATYIVDRKGVIAEVVRGARKWDKQDVRSMLDSLLAEPYAGERQTAPSSSPPCKTC